MQKVQQAEQIFVCLLATDWLVKAGAIVSCVWASLEFLELLCGLQEIKQLLSHVLEQFTHTAPAPTCHQFASYLGLLSGTPLNTTGT